MPDSSWRRGPSGRRKVPRGANDFGHFFAEKQSTIGHECGPIGCQHDVGLHVFFARMRTLGESRFPGGCTQMGTESFLQSG